MLRVNRWMNVTILLVCAEGEQMEECDVTPCVCWGEHMQECDDTASVC